MFTLTGTDTDKMSLKPIDISYCICLGQGEHVHTIPYYLFFIGPCICQCERTLMYRWGANCRVEFQQNSFNHKLQRILAELGGRENPGACPYEN